MNWNGLSPVSSQVACREREREQLGWKELALGGRVLEKQKGFNKHFLN